MGLTALASTAEALPTFSFTRLAGPTRYETAATIATSTFTTGSDWAIIATGENFPDALAGNYLAGFRNAPILLTPRAAPVHPATLAALVALRTKNVVLLGGTDAISAEVATALGNTASTAAASGNLVVTRIGGATRYDTMKLVAAAPGVTHPGVFAGKKTAIVVSGENFPDALSVGPISWAMRFPTLLTFPTTLAPGASESLSDLGIQQVIIAGGTAAVSAITEAAINAKGIATLVRFDGADRSDTSRKAADYAINNFGFKTTHFNVATGENSKIGADALAGGPHGGKEDPTANLVTNSSTDPGKVVDFAASRQATLVDGHALGGNGPDALPDSTLNTVAAAAAGGPALPLGTGSVTLRFSDSPTPTVDTYRVYRQVDPTPSDACEVPVADRVLPSGYVPVAEVSDYSGTSNTDPQYVYTDRGLVVGTTYCYIVRAVDDGDESVNSPIIRAIAT